MKKVHGVHEVHTVHKVQQVREVQKVQQGRNVRTVKPVPASVGAWIVAGAEAGLRLDKFLANPNRLGSRGRAVTALERGKVFVNDTEVSLDDAGRRAFWRVIPRTAGRW